MRWKDYQGQKKTTMRMQMKGRLVGNVKGMKKVIFQERK